MIKSRIVALALIGIILSSSSLSVADAYTLSLNINTTPLVASQAQIYKINLIDDVSASLKDNQKDFPTPYKIKLLDGVLAILNKPPDHEQNDNDIKLISVQVADGVGINSTKYYEDNNKIILIKNNDERKALWERIFPLDRIRNGVR